MLRTRVPGELLRPIIQQYIEKYETDLLAGETQGLGAKRILAERAGVPPDTLTKFLKGRSKTLDFDVADRLMCAMGAQGLWMQEPSLMEVYYEVDLSGPSEAAPPIHGQIRCARRGCSEMFVPTQPSRKYCSARCRGTSQKQRARGVRQLYGPAHKLRRLVCRNGHERTAENTRINNRGQISCLICQRYAWNKYAKTHQSKRSEYQRNRRRRLNGSG